MDMADEKTILAWGDQQGNGRTTFANLETYVNKPTKYKNEIGDFVYWRLYERYIRPFEILVKYETPINENIQIDAGQNDEPDQEEETQKRFKLRIGFAIMANMCLVIEALEAFRQGQECFYSQGEVKKDPNKMSYEDAFANFFKKEKAFGVKEYFGKEFYNDIRCRILHQGGIGKGWKIKHIKDSAKIIDEDAKIIDARKFLDTMANILKAYSDGLKNGTENINNCAIKCQAIIRSCNEN